MQLSDLNQLVFNVREVESKKLFGEALAAYRGGALRAALVATWIAAVYDIIAKARELAAQGEGVPGAFVKELDSAIAANNVTKLQQIESGILERANTDFGFFAPHEYTDLTRLGDDRNLCAHPAFVSEDGLFQPTPELVRMHLVHAVEHLLSRAPLQGKAATERLTAEMTRPSFPVTVEEVEVFLKDRYLDHAKDTLVVAILKALLGCAFGAEYKDHTSIARRVARSVGAIARAKPAIYEADMPKRIKDKAKAATDDQLLNLVRFIKADQRIWTWIASPDQIRLKRMLSAATEDQIKRFDVFDGLVHPDLRQALLDRFRELPFELQKTIVAGSPQRELTPWVLERFAGAGSFRGAEDLAARLILPMLPYFHAAEVEAILQAVLTNGQISEAGEMPDLVNQVFDGTTHLLPHTRAAWEDFADKRKDKGEHNERYAYPGITERLEKLDAA